MGIDFSAAQIDGGDRRWRALVVTAGVPVILGREKLEALRESTDMGDIDRMIVERVRFADPPFDLIIFRSKSEGDGCWTLSPDLSREELEEMGYLLSKAQAPTYRRFLAAGMLAIIHVESDPHVVDAFKAGSARLETELDLVPRDGSDAARIAADDRWTLKNLTFWFGISFEKAVASALPGRLRLLGPGVARMRELVSALPASAID